MELMEAIRTRRSIRKFTDAPVTEEMIRSLLEAAMLAPSAGNQQPWHFIVVTDRKRLDKVPEFHPYCGMIKNAQAAVVVCGAPEGIKWPDFWVQDCSAAVQNFLLAACDAGLGAVWTGLYPLEERMQGARQLFNIPEDVYPFAIIPVGWPDMDYHAVERFNPEIIHHESW